MTHSLRNQSETRLASTSSQLSYLIGWSFSCVLAAGEAAKEAVPIPNGAAQGKTSRPFILLLLLASWMLRVLALPIIPSMTSAAKIAWGHSVNSQRELAHTLRDDAITMIESDIMIAQDGTIIMSHPPDITSDLTLTDYLTKIHRFNSNNPRNHKGIKLDFKNPHAVAPAMSMLNDIWGRIDDSWNGPEVWLNADILQGPGGFAAQFDADKFIQTCQTHHPHAKLSLGFTTDRAPPTHMAYTGAMVDKMLDVCERHKVENVTFALSACHSWFYPKHVQRLLSIPGSSITFWGITNQAIRDWLGTWDEERIFIDIKEASGPEHHLLRLLGGWSYTGLFFG